jgi:hypothetical protein
MNMPKLKEIERRNDMSLSEEIHALTPWELENGVHEQIANRVEDIERILYEPWAEDESPFKRLGKLEAFFPRNESRPEASEP